MDGHTPDAEKSSTDRYYISRGGEKEREVPKREYISAEQNAGYRSKFGPDEVATSSFSSSQGGNSISGRIVHAGGRALTKGPASVVDSEQGPMQRSDDRSR